MFMFASDRLPWFTILGSFCYLFLKDNQTKVTVAGWVAAQAGAQ
jgi:hypothetical protein